MIQIGCIPTESVHEVYADYLCDFLNIFPSSTASRHLNSRPSQSYPPLPVITRTAIPRDGRRLRETSLPLPVFLSPVYYCLSLSLQITTAPHYPVLAVVPSTIPRLSCPNSKDRTNNHYKVGFKMESTGISHTEGPSPFQRLRRTMYKNAAETFKRRPCARTMGELTEKGVFCQSALDGLDSSFRRFLAVSAELESQKDFSISMPAIVLGSQEGTMDQSKVSTFDEVFSQIPPGDNWQLLYSHCEDLTASLKDGLGDLNLGYSLETAAIYSTHSGWAWNAAPMSVGMARMIAKEKLRGMPEGGQLLDTLERYPEVSVTVTRLCSES